VVLKGGTHVAWSPSFHYLQEVLLPLLRPLGISADIDLVTWGWYPQGGGVMRARIGGVGQDLEHRAERSQFRLVERGDLRKVWGIAATSRLPEHIRQRMRDQALALLRPLGMRTQIEMLEAPSPGPGAGLFLFARYDNGDGASSTAGFSGFGRRGRPAEAVAAEAAKALVEHHRSGTPVDPHLADQLVLPLALSGGRAEYRTSEITRHLTTNVEVVQQFLDLHVTVMSSRSNDAVVELQAG
jgi:RNA 3'-terminal phosphate cyclase (ATP)